MIPAVALGTKATASFGVGSIAGGIVGVVEIGPNLLSAITSIVGVAVLILQSRVVKKQKEIKVEAKATKEAAVESASHVATLAEVALKNRERIGALETDKQDK